MDTALLQHLLSIDSPSGNESEIADFIEKHIEKEVPKAKVHRVMNNVIALKGKPEVAVFAHIDTVGFMASYENTLTDIGAPKVKEHDLIENRSLGLKAKISEVTKNTTKCKSEQEIPLGTYLSFASNFKIDEENKKIHSCYLDNRLGVLNALELLKRCDNIAVAFTAKEEHYGQGARICAKMLFEKHGITKVLVSDITWTTKHVKLGNGAVISLRDGFVPNKYFADKVVAIAKKHNAKHQFEVEDSGRSDGSYIEISTYPIDWMFVGVCLDNYETAQESCSISDFDDCVSLCEKLVKEL
jgi:putative aminopeptidase FrvX